jgi:hypothetical protein
MQPWSKITHYAGFDWAHDHHEVVNNLYLLSAQSPGH